MTQSRSKDTPPEAALPLAWTRDLSSDSMSCTLASQVCFRHENACGR